MSTRYTYIGDMFRSSLLCASNQGRHLRNSTCDMLLEHAVKIKRWSCGLFLALRPDKHLELQNPNAFDRE